MIDPTRLIHEKCSPLERLFLLEAQSEEPDAELEALMLAPLSLGAPSPFSGVEASPAPLAAPGQSALGSGSNIGAATGNAALSIAPAAPALAPVFFLKWGAAGALALGLAGRGYWLSTSETAHTPSATLTQAVDAPAAVPSSPSSAPSFSTAPSDSVAPSSASTTSSSPSTTVSNAGAAAAAATTNAVGSTQRGTSSASQSVNTARVLPESAASAQTNQHTTNEQAAPQQNYPSSLAADDSELVKAEATSPAPASLKQELKILEQARTALKSGATQRALDLLSEYNAQFPSGVLKQEAAILKARALK